MSSRLINRLKWEYTKVLSENKPFEAYILILCSCVFPYQSPIRKHCKRSCAKRLCNWDTHTQQRSDMEFVQNFTPPDFQVKNFTPSILPYFNSFSKKKHKK